MTSEIKPLISFITPSFNREKLVAETLESLLGQEDPRWENVIVDDGSTDKTAEIIQSYVQRDARFRFFRRDREPKGACICRNIGVERAHGRYVVFLDTDDLVAPHCAGQRVRTMEANPDLDFGVFQAMSFEHQPGDLGRWWNIDKVGADELGRQFRQDALCQGTGPAFKKESFVKVGLWDETLTLWQDIDLFFRLYIQRYRYRKFFQLPADVHIREYPHSLSRSDFFARHKLESRFRVVQRAVQLLVQTGQHGRAREARYMAYEIISGSARSNNHDLASQIVQWAGNNGVLNRTELTMAKRYCMASRTRLTRFRLVAKWFQHRMRSCEVTEPRTMGRVPSTQPPVADLVAQK